MDIIHIEEIQLFILKDTSWNKQDIYIRSILFGKGVCDERCVVVAQKVQKKKWIRYVKNWSNEKKSRGSLQLKRGVCERRIFNKIKGNVEQIERRSIIEYKFRPLLNLKYIYIYTISVCQNYTRKIRRTAATKVNMSSMQR